MNKRKWNDTDSRIAEQLASVARRLQAQRTGHTPKSVTVVLDDDTLVVTLHEALTLAEKALSQSPEGAAQVQEFHRQLFANSTDEMRQEITRITGRQVREAAAEVETTTGTVVHAFKTGAMVQVFLLAPGEASNADPGNEAIELAPRAEDDGLPVTPPL
ncbi:MAG: Na-translocating system protein MpsC family protein [Terriglobales bacterium]